MSLSSGGILVRFGCLRFHLVRDLLLLYIPLRLSVYTTSGMVAGIALRYCGPKRWQLLPRGVCCPFADAGMYVSARKISKVERAFWRDRSGSMSSRPEFNFSFRDEELITAAKRGRRQPLESKVDSNFERRRRDLPKVYGQDKVGIREKSRPSCQTDIVPSRSPCVILPLLGGSA